MAQVSTERAGYVTLLWRRNLERAGRGAPRAFSLAAVLLLAGWPATADARFKPAPRFAQSQVKHAGAEPFGPIPKGPLQVIISVDQQKLHLYSDGAHVADSLVATGVLEHPTPLGVFDIIQKSRFHRSNIYSNAPMPYMQRITWSGVALHEGVGAGHRASHGCIRLPHEFATQLWELTRLGARVIIAEPELQPEPIADLHLFVHKEPPAEAVPAASAPASVKPLMTAQSLEGANTTDAGRDESKDAADPPAPRDAADPPPPRDAADPPAPRTGQAAPPTGQGNGAAAVATAPVADPPSPSPPAKPIDMLRKPSKAPIAIFISRKTQKIYVRQDFSPLFSAPVVIANPEQRFGTHIFTALDYLDDGSTLRRNVVSLPGEQTQAARRAEYERQYAGYAKARRRDDRFAQSPSVPPPPQTPQQALARIDIPQDVIERISRLIGPGSSLIVSDQGLGDETGEGTDFIVIAR